MSTHHLFSPSSAHRWMVCAPSIAMSRSYDRQVSYDAAEGTIAHSMAATCLQTELDSIEVWQSVETASADGFDVPITPEMRGYVQQYVNYVRALGGGMEVECHMQFATEPDLGGTSDTLVWDIGDSVLHVVDFKYGKGIRVHAERNWQMLIYALLAISRDPELFPIEKIVLHIHQPRIDNISTWECTPDDLVKVAVEVSLAMVDARKVMRVVDAGGTVGVDQYTPGTHCKFCPHAPDCIGLREQSILNAQAVFADISAVPSQTLGMILSKADMIDAWIAAVRKEAMDRALKGDTIEGHKLVQKRPQRQWKDESLAVACAIDNMLDVWTPRVIMSPPMVEKAVGKGAYGELFAPIVHMVSSGLTLVAADDKRPAVDPTTAAAEKAAGVFTAIE